MQLKMQLDSLSNRRRCLSTEGEAFLYLSAPDCPPSCQAQKVVHDDALPANDSHYCP